MCLHISTLILIFLFIFHTYWNIYIQILSFWQIIFSVQRFIYFLAFAFSAIISRCLENINILILILMFIIDTNIKLVWALRIYWVFHYSSLCLLLSLKIFINSSLNILSRTIFAAKVFQSIISVLTDGLTDHALGWRQQCEFRWTLSTGNDDFSICSQDQRNNIVSPHERAN